MVAEVDPFQCTRCCSYARRVTSSGQPTRGIGLFGRIFLEISRDSCFGWVHPRLLHALARYGRKRDLKLSDLTTTLLLIIISAYGTSRWKLQTWTLYSTVHLVSSE